ncbi:polysaccharide biosynthesis tyrosine autokinase [Ornithinimicrobium pratense]|uniref:Polysaccharide biosynthesis tyrosine autokinase n=1 Tax=Ornithinimicrobium pratense TaxID=2593973 RepID=A0A5J6V9B5_9MICO|nr:polysaccharide biosynthesis tyrosine autokinase [Ornithinimicrobium pratense]QFG69723.1 polysaccharide biosynthesis tyrosine autokinase [Ornithinimicrobium pratense]
MLVTSVLGVAGGALASAVMPREYQAHSEVFVAVTSVESFNEQAQGNALVESRIRSYAAIADSPLVVGPVIERLGLDATIEDVAEQISADVRLDTVLVTITVTDDTAEGSAALANAVVESWSEAVETIGTLPDGTLEGVNPPSVALLPTMTATVPEEPSQPMVFLNLVLGGLIGLTAGVATALLRRRSGSEPIDDADVLRLVDAVLLGKVPQVGQGVQRSSDQDATSAESFRRIRTTMQFHSSTRGVGSVLVTSALPGEGKTTVASQLALAMAAAGVRVCLVDGNLQQPAVAAYLGAHPAPGLSDVLSDPSLLPTAIADWGEHGLAVLPAGSNTDHPGELLASPAMGNVFTSLRREYELVLVDAPSLLSVTDTAVLAGLTEGTLLVVASSQPTHDDLDKALDALGGVEARLIGVVLNKVRSSSRGKASTSRGKVSTSA